MPPGRFSWLLNPAVVIERLRGLLRFLKSPIDTAAFHLFRLLFPPPDSQVAQVLLLFRLDGIGDFVFFTRYLPLIHSAFPGFRIALICRKEVAPLARHVEGIDEVVDLDAKLYQWNYVYRFLFLRRIRSFLPHTTIYLSYHRRHLGDEITLLSGARSTIAFSGNEEIIRPAVRRRNNRYYSTIIETPDHIPEGEKYFKLINALGGESVGQVDPGMPLKVEVRNRQPVARPPFAMIAPGSTSRLRRWPAERFSLVADEISERHSLTVVLCGDRSERALLRSVAGRMKRPQEILDELSLIEIVSVLKESSLFVGNDAGLLHLAAALGVPAVGIVGGGHFNRYFPYGTMVVASNPLPCFHCNWKCRYRKAFCVTDIRAESVLKAAEEVLKTR